MPARMPALPGATLPPSALAPAPWARYFGAFGDTLLHPELDPYPDGLLARLARRGVNGVWLHALLRGLAPGGKESPEFGAGHERRLETLALLVERARRHGISVCLYMNEPRSMPRAFFERHPGVEGVREGEHAALRTSTAAVRRPVRAPRGRLEARPRGLRGRPGTRAARVACARRGRLRGSRVRPTSTSRASPTRRAS
jgi:hypothetical protein